MFRSLIHLHPYLSLSKCKHSLKTNAQGKELSARLPMKHYTHDFPLANTLPVSLTEIVGKYAPTKSAVTACL